jgi:tetratricopeptide (TPR) repeat protein
MKRLFTFSVMVLLAGLGMAQSDVAEQASTAYLNGNYERAVQLYESLLAEGIEDSSVYFNLGNAYFQSGESGHALVNYLRAQNLFPRDSDIHANMAFIRARRLDLQGDEAGFLESLAVLSGILTLTELAWIVFILWALWFGVLCFAILRESWRDILRAPLLLVGVVILAGLILLASRLYINASTQSAVVVWSTVAVMSGPGEEYLEMFEIHEAAELRIWETRDEWIRFALPDGRQGWITLQSVVFV